MALWVQTHRSTNSCQHGCHPHVQQHVDVSSSTLNLPLMLLFGAAAGSSCGEQPCPSTAPRCPAYWTQQRVWGCAGTGLQVGWSCGPQLLCENRGHAHVPYTLDNDSSLCMTEVQEGGEVVCSMITPKHTKHSLSPLCAQHACIHVCCHCHASLTQCVWASRLPIKQTLVRFIAGASLQSAWLSGRDLANRLAALRGKTPDQAQQLAIGLQEQFVPLAEATSSAAEIGEFPGCKVPAAASPAQQQRRPQQQQRQPQQRQPQQQVQGGGGGPRQQRAPAQQRTGR
jgi:hypothetical protein